MSDSNTADIQARVAETRAQLESTLDAIEDKLNVPKQLGEFAEKAKAKYDQDPVPWIAGAAAVVAVVGSLIVWSILSKD